MKNIYTLLFICFIAFNSSAQKVIAYENVASYTPSEISALIPFSFAYGAKVYRVEYESPDVHGDLDTLSGLIAFPENTTNLFPKLSYMHGTVASRTAVPSYQSTESNVIVAMAGFGYASVAPDYPGLGIGRGFHPYVHAESEAQSGIDLVIAMEEIAANEGYLLNDQLFITGYSQGGHAAMAMTKLVEEKYSNDYTVTASAPMSGPYSISGIMLDFVLAENVYGTPAYLPNVLLSMQTAYGNLYNDLSEVVRAPYVDKILEYYNEDIDLLELNTFLFNKLTELEGASIAVKIFNQEYIDQLSSDPQHPFLLALQDQDVDNWMSNTPLRMFYCTGDDQVSYLNAIQADSSMNAMGSFDVESELVGGATVDHGGCFTPAFFGTRIFFGGYQQITSPVNNLSITSFDIYPNPTEGYLQYELPENITIDNIKVINIIGQTETFRANTTNTIDLTQHAKGMKLVEFYNEAGELIGVEKVIVQ